MRTLVRALGRNLAADIWASMGAAVAAAGDGQFVVLAADGYCYTVPNIVLDSDGHPFEVINEVGSAGHLVPMEVLQSDGGTSIVLSTVRDSDGNTFFDLAEDYFYVHAGTSGEGYITPAYTVRASDGYYFTIPPVALNSSGTEFTVQASILDSVATPFSTECGYRFTVLDADGNGFAVNRAVLGNVLSEGASYTVKETVLDTDGNSFFTASGDRLEVLATDGNDFHTSFAVIDSDGNSFTVTSAVLDTDGNSHTVN